MKFLKFLIAVLLWIPCIALTTTLYHRALALGIGYGPWLQRPALWMAMGFVCWIVIYIFLGPSARAYIISHELTHAIWTLLMGGRVSGIKSGATGGQVRVSKENWLITLSPYFVPLYTLLVIAIYFGVGFFGDVRPFAPLLYYLIGFTWSFHLVYTLTVLQQSQSDVRRHGWLFSMTIIYGMNLVVIALLLAILSPRVSVLSMGDECWIHIRQCWSWLVAAYWQVYSMCHRLLR